ncbi:MAG: hypothetical protein JW781_01360 [Deltaproteobacteria bacterium]|nr:hypothetical protein [Candidatus Anaeroferrophillacea bacterium]
MITVPWIRVRLLLMLLPALAAALTACSRHDDPLRNDYIYERTYKTGIIAERLAAPLVPPQWSTDTVIVVTSFVTLDDLRHTSRFGLVMGEQLLSRLAAMGFRVREVRMQDIFYQEPNGEFVLSRDFARVAHELDADLALVGTYMETANHVIVTARLVNFHDNEVVSSTDCQLPKTEDVISLLHHTAPAADSGSRR